MAGAGAYEIAAHAALMKYKDTVKGRARLGIQAFADALLIIPKVLAQNAGFDSQETIVKLQEEYAAAQQLVGLDIGSGKGLSDCFYIGNVIFKEDCFMIFFFGGSYRV